MKRISIVVLILCGCLLPRGMGPAANLQVPDLVGSVPQEEHAPLESV